VVLLIDKKVLILYGSILETFMPHLVNYFSGIREFRII